MNIQRLIILRDFLVALPEEAVDLEDWVSDLRLNESCGTIACAVGWAAQIPAFNAEGLTLHGWCPMFTDKSLSPDDYGHATDSWGAVTKFFGLSLEQAHGLFDGKFMYDGCQGSKVYHDIRGKAFEEPIMTRPCDRDIVVERLTRFINQNQ